MLRIMLKSNVHRAKVTQADLHYVSSVTADEDLREAADLLEGEQVSVDVTNGRASRRDVLTGPAAPAVGSGVGGLTAALQAAEAGSVLRVTMVLAGDGSTRWAQDDSLRTTAGKTTLVAGVGLCDVEPCGCCSPEGPGWLPELVALRSGFDRDPSGELSLTREGGHHRHGGSTQAGTRQSAAGDSRRAAQAEAARRAAAQVADSAEPLGRRGPQPGGGAGPPTE
jgi:aspartate 1-decarboxylase